ncbi:hypothetical protein SJI19_14050 [Acerihabitans sp. TG2]|uniref:hypothetical protein n=1 Tax=Acerihabitans sp. TG2 TaxID=3096008 RepID=UPI002B23E664|nr:hypothetical protein [Acerihabitans sp. TG2]MEA9391654.1 hypothetical protein [Acerihabitans sp. TG2]
MLRSLTTCFPCPRSAPNHVENVDMAAGHISSDALGQTLIFAGNTVVSSVCHAQVLSAGRLTRGVTVGRPTRFVAAKPAAATDPPALMQEQGAATGGDCRYVRKNTDVPKKFTYKTSCLRPGSLFILLESFSARNEQEAHEHFSNMVSIVSTWPPRWQGKGWPVVAQYCLETLSNDDLPAACRVLIDAGHELSHCARENVLRSIVDRIKYASGAVQSEILLMLLDAESLKNIESRNVMMYEFIQNVHIDKLPDARLVPVCSSLLDVGDNVCQDIQENITRNVLYVIKLIPLATRDKIMIRLLEQSRFQSPEAREYLLDQLSLEIYHLPLERIIPALVVLLEQLSLLPQPKQKPVLKELCYQLQYIKLGEIQPEVVKILTHFANRNQI